MEITYFEVGTNNRRTIGDRQGDIMASFNKIIIVGYLGGDPELRYTADGKPVCSFNVATNEKRKLPNGEYEGLTHWFKITFWNRQAEVATEYLRKGKQVYVEGTLSPRTWYDRDGVERHTNEVKGTALQFIGAAGDGEQVNGAPSRAPNRPSAPGKEEIPTAPYDDDIPF